MSSAACEAARAVKPEGDENIVKPWLCIFLPTPEMLTKDNVEVSKLGGRKKLPKDFCDVRGRRKPA